MCRLVNKIIMNHKLLLSEKDRWLYFYSYLNIGEEEVWRKEDRPRLQPFFKYSEGLESRFGNKEFRKMNEEECISFDYYKKCCEEYSDEISDKKESVSQIDINALCEAFGYELPDDPDDDSEEYDYSIDKPFKSSMDLTFPVVCINWMESTWDRQGDMAICCVDYVEYKEFDHAKTIAMLSK